MNIAEWWGSIKSRTDIALSDWSTFVVIIFLGAAAFGLGRLSALEEAQPPVSLREAPTKAMEPEALSPGGLVVASRTGSVYYFPWCRAAQNIAPQNRRWFTDEQSAEAAGYRKAKSC